MMIDLTPSMLDAIANIGARSVTAHDIGVNGGVLKRLWELGFLKIDMPAHSYFPPYYSLSDKGHGAAAILNRVLTPVDREAPIARIKRTVASHYRIPTDEMVSARRSKKVSRPRQVAMYLARQLTPKSYPDIGRNFGNRDHTTVIHAVKTVERMITENSDFKDEITTLEQELGSSTLSVEMEPKSVADALPVEA